MTSLNIKKVKNHKQLFQVPSQTSEKIKKNKKFLIPSPKMGESKVKNTELNWGFERMVSFMRTKWCSSFLNFTVENQYSQKCRETHKVH